MNNYPKVREPDKVGEYPALVNSGGGYVWDDVLEYRVWCHPHDGAPDLEDGSDYYYAFDSYIEALACSKDIVGAEEPIALVLQLEYINEPETGVYEHIKQERLTEWPVKFLSRPRRSESTIPDFMSPNAPKNKLDILRGNK